MNGLVTIQDGGERKNPMPFLVLERSLVIKKRWRMAIPLLNFHLRLVFCSSWKRQLKEQVKWEKRLGYLQVQARMNVMRIDLAVLPGSRFSFVSVLEQRAKAKKRRNCQD